MTLAMSSLELVQSGLFATLEGIEKALDQFIAEKTPALLEQVRENLLQMRGTLNLIELNSADFLLQEIYRLLNTSVKSPDNCLPAVLSSLHALRRHLECNDGVCLQHAEFMLPIINALRTAHNEKELREGFFFRTKINAVRPQVAPTLIDSQSRATLARRLRQMYQVGLLGLLREQNPQASIKLMARAFERLDSLFAGSRNDRLFWVSAATLEAFASGGLLIRKERRRLFSQLDRELKQRLKDSNYESSKELYKELLYLIALSTSEGQRTRELRETFELPILPFSDNELKEHRQRLLRPNRTVMHSLTRAVREELTNIQEIVDLIARGTHAEENLSSLKVQLSLLANTLSMIDLPHASSTLNAQINQVEQWVKRTVVPPAELLQLADALLFLENLLSRLERGELFESEKENEENADKAFTNFIHQQLMEARIATIDEARLGLVQARKALNAWLESEGDKSHLTEVPDSLSSLCGGLWFLGQTRMLKLVQGCRDYIQKQILASPQMPNEQDLEILADALTSLEYYLESGSALQRSGGQAEALLLAMQSLKSLGVSIAP